MKNTELFFDQLSSELYDYYMSDTNDVPFWLSLAEAHGSKTLELACGTGRALLPLARAGIEVTGIDKSPHMLAIAHRKLVQEDPDVQARVRLIEGGITNFSLGERFGLICVPENSFQILKTRADQRSCLECAARHLAPDGCLAIVVFNPKLNYLIQPGGLDSGPTEFTGPQGEKWSYGAHKDFDQADQLMNVSWRGCKETADGTETHEYPFQLHYFFCYEMEWMFEACGLEVDALHGDFDFSSFTAESKKIIFVVKRCNR